MQVQFRKTYAYDKGCVLVGTPGTIKEGWSSDGGKTWNVRVEVTQILMAGEAAPVTGTVDVPVDYLGVPEAP